MAKVSSTVSRCFFFTIFCCFIAPPVLSCPLADSNIYDTVSSVIDGDSVFLTEHGEARLIGINAPEYRQPLGPQSTRSLDRLLEGKRVLVQYGKEKKDRYGRYLLHIQTLNGINPASVQLKKGYAFHIVVPPNEFNIECYAASEKEARKAKLNIWNHSAYKPRRITKYSSHTGFIRVQGQIMELKSKQAGIELFVRASRLRLFIPTTSVPLFGGQSKVKKWQGADFIARGWLTKRNGKKYLSLRLEHPSMIEYMLKEGRSLLEGIYMERREGKNE